MLTSKHKVALVDIRFDPSTKIRANVDVDTALRTSEIPKSTLDFIIENGQTIDIRSGQVLHEAGQRLQSIYFILDGLVSVSLSDTEKASAEVLTLGSGDLSGLPYALNGQRSPHRSVVQAPGSAVRLTVSDLSRLLDQHGPLHDLLLEMISMQCLHGSYLVACNARHSVGQRLSRWLLISSDQLGSHSIPVTHKTIAEAIGVRRAGITKEISDLQGRGLLTTTRGSLTIADIDQLERCACGCYEPVRAARRHRFGVGIFRNHVE